MAVDGHSEEVEAAICRLHQSGEDIKGIINRLKSCQLFVSRKYINLALRRGLLSERIKSNRLQEIRPTEDDPNISVSEDVLEEMEIDAGGEKSRDEEVMVTTEEDGVHDHDVGLTGEVLLTQEPEIQGLSSSSSKPKARRIKTTDDLILRIQEDFRERPDIKVKDRASKFGIAVGTLCQIKHSILKMPKESGRTWKSTPQMVGAIEDDIRQTPSLKVKERAQKFGISVGTLCRIMHDMLSLPKRVVQRSGATRAPRTRSDQSANADGTAAPRTVRKRKKLPLPTQANMEISPQNITQLCLKSNSDGQVIVVRFDADSAAQLRGESSGLPHVGNEEVIWVVNSAPDEEHASSEFEAPPDESNIPLPEAETGTESS